MLSSLFACLDLSVVLTLLALLSGICLVYYSTTIRGLPPFPKWPLPVVGNLHNFDANPREQLLRWRKQHGDIYSIYFGPTLVIVLNGYDLIKEALITQGEKILDRPITFYDVATDTVNLGIGMASGDSWREERSVATRIFRELGMGHNAMAERINEEISHFLKELDKSGGRPIDVQRLMHHSVSNVISSMLVGKRFDYGDESFQRMTTILHEYFALLGNNMILNYYPSLRHLPGNLFKSKTLATGLRTLFAVFSENYVKRIARNPEEYPSDNYISSYLDCKERKLQSGKQTYMSDKNLSKTINDFFMAGTETTSVTILWWMLFMIRHPQIQEKVFEEVKSEIGLERCPQLKDKTKLNYTNAVIFETQRNASVSPMGLLQICTTDVSLRGFTIPKGACIAKSFDSVMFDENIWGSDPRSFRPERFLDQDGKLRNFEELISFSIGKRACPAESIAMTELFLYITSLIQRFEMRPADANKLPELTGHYGISYSPMNFQVRLIKRDGV